MCACSHQFLYLVTLEPENAHPALAYCIKMYDFEFKLIIEKQITNESGLVLRNLNVNFKLLSLCCGLGQLYFCYKDKNTVYSIKINRFSLEDLNQMDSFTDRPVNATNATEVFERIQLNAINEKLFILYSKLRLINVIDQESLQTIQTISYEISLSAVHQIEFDANETMFILDRQKKRILVYASDSYFKQSSKKEIKLCIEKNLEIENIRFCLTYDGNLVVILKVNANRDKKLLVQIYK